MLSLSCLHFPDDILLLCLPGFWLVDTESHDQILSSDWSLSWWYPTVRLPAINCYDLCDPSNQTIITLVYAGETVQGIFYMFYYVCVLTRHSGEMTRDSAKEKRKNILKSNYSLLKMLISNKIQKMHQETNGKRHIKVNQNLFFMLCIPPSTSWKRHSK